MDQSYKSWFIIVLLSALSVGLAHGQIYLADSLTQQHYWKTMLPNTPMPQSLLDTLPKSGKADGMEDSSIASFLKPDTVFSAFILEKDLIPGTKMDIQFKSNIMLSPRFPSPQMAQKMPSLTSKNLPQLLQFFSVSPNSETAEIISHTLAKCEQPEAFMGGVQFCATDIEKMVTLVTSGFGDSQNIRAVSMPSSLASDTSVAYKIMDARKIAEDQSSIACHKRSFPIGLYYCHQPRGTTAWAVSLVTEETGVEIDAYVTCHEHSSEWFPKDLFKTLGVKPGTKVCHVNLLDDVIWYEV